MLALGLGTCPGHGDGGAATLAAFVLINASCEDACIPFDCFGQMGGNAFHTYHGTICIASGRARLICYVAKGGIFDQVDEICQDMTYSPVWYNNGVWFPSTTAIVIAYGSCTNYNQTGTNPPPITGPIDTVYLNGYPECTNWVYKPVFARVWSNGVEHSEMVRIYKKCAQ